MVRPRRLAIAAASIAAAFALLLIGLWLGVPAAVRWGLETAAAREIGRTIQVGEIRFNPFNLRLDLRELSIAGAAGATAPLLTLSELHTQIGFSSLFRLAPIVRSLRLQTLRANVTRLAPNRFNFSDIVERFAAAPGEGEPARFSVNNIELADGAIAFDDRVVGKTHAITEVGFGIPFISSLPDDEEIRVKPSFAARVNGAPLRLDGETLPFADSLETSVNIRFNGLHLPTYIGYVPLPLKFSLPTGALDSDLRLAFRRAVAAQDKRPAQPARLLLTGRAAVREFALLPEDMKQPLVEWHSLDIVLDEIEPLRRSAKLASVTLTAPKFRANLRSDGTLAGQAAFGGTGAQRKADQRPAAAAKPGGAAPAARPFDLSIAQIRLVDGTVDFRDETVDFSRSLQSIAVSVDGLSTRAEAPAKLTVDAVTDDKAKLKVSGELRPVPLRLAAEATASAVPLAGIAPYLRPFTNATADGAVDVGARIAAEQSGENLSVKISDGRLTTAGLRVRGPSGNAARLTVSKLEASGIGADLNKRSVAIERVRVTSARALATRAADGRIDWRALLKEATKKEDDGGKPWSVDLDQLELINARLQATDETVQPPVRLAAEQLDVNVRNAGSDLRKPITLQLRTQLGGGTVQARGWLRAEPLAAELKLEVANVDISALRPYEAPYSDVVLASAAVSADGTLSFSMPNDAPAIRYQGNAQLTNFAALNPDGATELARWQALALDSVTVDTGAQPVLVDIGAIKLNDFYARAILSAQGKLSLVEVLAGRKADDSPGQSPPAASPPAPAPSSDATAGAARALVRIGGIEILRGNVNYTDNFVKPNYTANLTDLAGTVGALASDRAELADVSIRGRVDGDAPLEITGKVNPLATQLALDLRGSAKGVELPRLTPYSAKYAGYPISRGKLSMDVHYKIADNKLQADNRLFLDQLTFGERVESPTATKLPVTLAVALLKNSRGEIDINLPISGSLDDPEFSIGGIIVQAIVNLLTKIITAPFAMLSAAFGGGADLGHVAFAPGSARFDEGELKKLETLAKALNDRPALRLDITGHAQAAADIEALRRAKFDAKLRAAKVKELVKAGESVDPATVKIPADERERLIGRVYADEKIPDKPRNWLGIAKTIPAAEMEKLIMATVTAGEEDLRRLANDRAVAVRDQLNETGKVPRERLFLVAPLIDASGDGKLPPTRVDFSLK